MAVEPFGEERKSRPVPIEATDASEPDQVLLADADAMERAVTRLAWLERKLFSIQLERLALTPAQYFALVQISRLGPSCAMGNLATNMYQSSATMTGIVDRLVRRKLAVRKQDPADRRRVVVTLTEGGRHVLAQAHGFKRQRTVEVLASFPEADRRSLVALLEAYGQHLTDRLASEERDRTASE